MKMEHNISHHIQRRIFNRLVGAESLRYSELKPKEIEANLFMYHLKELMKMGLVEKDDKNYRLTESGKMLATKFSVREVGIRQMPSTLSIIVLRASDGSWLLYERKRQPYIGWLGWPSGKIHMGETLNEAGRREASEKCGYEDIDLHLLGNFSLVTKGIPSDFVNHVIGYVWFAEVAEKREFENHAGHTFWVDDWRSLDYERFIPGFKEIVAEIESSRTPFSLDLCFSADS